MQFIKRMLFSLIRIWLGYMWLMAGIEKLHSAEWIGPHAGTALTRFLLDAIAHSTGDHPTVQAWYARVAEQVVLPHASTLAHVITGVEIVLGVALLLGIFTSCMAVIGGLLNLIYLLGNTAGINPLMYTAALVLVVSGSAAGYYGVDRHIVPALTRGVRSVLARADRG